MTFKDMTFLSKVFYDYGSPELNWWIIIIIFLNVSNRYLSMSDQQLLVQSEGRTSGPM